MSVGTDAILTGGPVTATGGVTRGPKGSTLPTDASAALDAAFEALGYVGADGVTRTIDASDEKITAWGGDVVKVVRTEHSVTYSMVFLESANATLLKAIHGEENVTIAGNKITIRHTKTMPPRAAYTLEMLDGLTAIREVIPDAQISSSGDAVFVHSDVIRYTITLEAFPDAAGVKAYSYIDNPAEGSGGE